MSDFVHGGNAYRNHNCRCEVCTEGNRLLGIRYRRSRGIMPKPPKGTNATHGLISTYRKGCRCEDCRRAAAVKRRNQRHATGQTKSAAPDRRKYA